MIITRRDCKYQGYSAPNNERYSHDVNAMLVAIIHALNSAQMAHDI